MMSGNHYPMTMWVGGASGWGAGLANNLSMVTMIALCSLLVTS